MRRTLVPEQRLGRRARPPRLPVRHRPAWRALRLAYLRLQLRHRALRRVAPSAQADERSATRLPAASRPARVRLGRLIGAVLARRPAKLLV
jgi:hypothetical protein